MPTPKSVKIIKTAKAGTPSAPAHTGALARLNQKMMQCFAANSPAEGLFAIAQLSAEIAGVIRSGKDAPLAAWMDTLWQERPTFFELAADLIENHIQTMSWQPETGGAPLNTLLIALPVLTWSRNSLPQGKTPPAVIEGLKQALHAHCLAPGVQLTLGHTLYSPDQLPEGFSPMYKMAQKHFEAAKKGKDLPHTPTASDHDEQYFLADTRFWLGTLTAPTGQALYQCQIAPDTTAALVTAWLDSAHAVIEDVFAGCSASMLSPASYFTAQRHADIGIRPFSLQAAAMMVMSSLGLAPDDIRVAIGGCGDRGFEEYRISMMTRQSDIVLQGISWPLLDHEEDEQVLLKDIQALLTTMKITRVKVLEDRLPMEYCDDCNAPLFPDMSADLVHTGSPDEDHHDHSKLIIH